MVDAIKFRPHRGGFHESMAEVISVNSVNELKAILLNNGLKVDNITFSKHHKIDERNGWDTRTVLADGQAIGFSNGILNPKQQQIIPGYENAIHDGHSHHYGTNNICIKCGAINV